MHSFKIQTFDFCIAKSLYGFHFNPNGQTKKKEGKKKKQASEQNPPRPTESPALTFIFFRTCQAANLVKIHPASSDSFPNWMVKAILLPPAVTITSQSNGLLPSPHPLQLPALSSRFLRARQAAADRTARTRGTIREAWEQHLNLVPITPTTIWNSTDGLYAQNQTRLENLAQTVRPTGMRN